MKRAFLFLFIFVFITGCAQLERRERGQKKPKTPSPFDEQIKEKPDSEADEDDYGQEPVSKDIKAATEAKVAKLGVVLGPGGLKTMAQASVLKALAAENIPITAVVGLEWGALIGALYASKEQVHKPEWEIYKLKADELPGRSFFGGDISPESISTLRPFLQRNFSGQRIEQSAVEFTCPSLNLTSGQLRWQQKGLYQEALERCLPFPPYYKPDGPWMAAPFEVQEAIQYLKRRGVNVVVFVDVLDANGPLLPSSVDYKKRPEAHFLWHQIRRAVEAEKNMADYLVEVNTRRFRLFDLDQRKALLSAGAAAGEQAAKDLVTKYGF